MNIKNLIANSIKLKIDAVDYEKLIIESLSADKGDYCLPCFAFAKTMKQNPNEIANQILNSVDIKGVVEKCEVVGGYVNFFLNKQLVAKEILEKFSAYNLKLNFGENKVVCVDYGSPNLAKFLHIGHLKTLIIGESLCRLMEQCGYIVKRLNYIGDYGTPFGKIIGGLLKWGSVDEVKMRGNDALQEYYVKFNQEEANDATLTQYARDIFKKIEEKDAEIYPLYEFIISIGVEECKKMFGLLGVEFDDYRGEEYYNQFVPQIIEMLQEKNLLTQSQGATIVDLEPHGLTPAVVLKSDGTSLYTTRDICAVIERHKEYDFDKMLYVTDVAQVLNFKQLFKIMELADYDFAKDMEHVPYGRFSLPDGKISSRRGKQAVLVDLLEYVLNKAKEVIKDRKFEIENPNDVVNKVASAVLNFNVLKVERNKDCVFDIEKAFSFEGETAPYMQYTFTRLESILRKYQETDAVADYSWLNEDAMELVKNINDFTAIMCVSLEKRDISIIVKRIMEMCKTFNKFYTNCKVLDGNDSTTKAKINLVKALRDTLSVGFRISCIETLKEM